MTNNKVLDKLEAIENLLVLFLIKSGANSKEISRATGMDSSTIRKKFPMKKTKKGE
jgi:NADH/NAD ratio-sensing transcriptional regulator Rex